MWKWVKVQNLPSNRTQQNIVIQKFLFRHNMLIIRHKIKIGSHMRYRRGQFFIWSFCNFIESTPIHQRWTFTCLFWQRRQSCHYGYECFQPHIISGYGRQCVLDTGSWLEPFSLARWPREMRGFPTPATQLANGRGHNFLVHRDKVGKKTTLDMIPNPTLERTHILSQKLKQSMKVWTTKSAKEIKTRSTIVWETVIQTDSKGRC